VRDSQALIRSLTNQDVQTQNTKKKKKSIAKNVQNPAVSGKYLLIENLMLDHLI
jgi:hypothetical protein